MPAVSQNGPLATRLRALVPVGSFTLQWGPSGKAFIAHDKALEVNEAPGARPSSVSSNDVIRPEHDVVHHLMRRHHAYVDFSMEDEVCADALEALLAPFMTDSNHYQSKDGEILHRVVVVDERKTARSRFEPLDPANRTFLTRFAMEPNQVEATAGCDFLLLDNLSLALEPIAVMSRTLVATAKAALTAAGGSVSLALEQLLSSSNREQQTWKNMVSAALAGQTPALLAEAINVILRAFPTAKVDLVAMKAAGDHASQVVRTLLEDSGAIIGRNSAVLLVRGDSASPFEHLIATYLTAFHVRTDASEQSLPAVDYQLIDVELQPVVDPAD